jgi:hypothetical protein
VALFALKIGKTPKGGVSMLQIRRCLVSALTWLVIACGAVSAARAQQTVHIWVHPTDGVDPNTGNVSTYVNNPNNKCKTLQAAIDLLQYYIVTNYSPTDEVHGVVFAMPGLYGPFDATFSSGDVLPIRMRDRIHVQGLGARRCVIRGASTVTTPAPNYTSTSAEGQMFWPASSMWQPNLMQDKEVLVTYRYSVPNALTPVQQAAPPWYTGAPAVESANVAEVLDGFTFEGGDVQVRFDPVPAATYGAPAYVPAGRVSNCVFDLRHDWQAVQEGANISGPDFGVMIVRTPAAYGFAGSIVGYLDGRILVAHNTFVFARSNPVDPAVETWESQSKNSAVGIIDVTDPTPNFTWGDTDLNLRGAGHPCIVGNVFRTRPVPVGQSPRAFAMLGIRNSDTVTNAFDPSRVGSTNGAFYSIPVQTSIVQSAVVNGWADLWNCSTYTPYIPPPTPCNPDSAPSSPAVHIWDGANGVDPGFVGEYISLNFGGVYPALFDHRDWRLLPGSPLEDGSVMPDLSHRGYRTGSFGLTGFTYFTTLFPEIDLFAWDGEHWGNPRVVGSLPDIGFDERHLVTCAGDWSNDSNSHNVAGFMHPNVVNGVPNRYFILPDSAGGVSLNAPNRDLRVYQTQLAPTPPSTGPAWIQPPLALATPLSTAALPVDFRRRYIPFAFPQPVPWLDQALATASGSYVPLSGATGQPMLTFRVAQQYDDECALGPCSHTYFNMQAVVLDPSTSTELLRSNLQAEYR